MPENDQKDELSPPPPPSRPEPDEQPYLSGSQETWDGREETAEDPFTVPAAAPAAVAASSPMKGPLENPGYVENHKLTDEQAAHFEKHGLSTRDATDPSRKI